MTFASATGCTGKDVDIAEADFDRILPTGVDEADSE